MFEVSSTRSLSAPGGHLFGQMICSPPGPNRGPFKTRLLPDGGLPRVLGARSPVPSRLLPFATPLSNWLAGAYPLRGPPNEWLLRGPALSGPCYWLFASGTPTG